MLAGAILSTVVTRPGQNPLHQAAAQMTRAYLTVICMTVRWITADSGNRLRTVLTLHFWMSSSGRSVSTLFYICISVQRTAVQWFLKATAAKKAITDLLRAASLVWLLATVNNLMRLKWWLQGLFVLHLCWAANCVRVEDFPKQPVNVVYLPDMFSVHIPWPKSPVWLASISIS